MRAIVFDLRTWMGLAVLAGFSACGERAEEVEAGGENPGGAGEVVALEEDTVLVERGMAAAEALKKSLGTQLKAAMAGGGHGGAIDACRLVAQTVTQSTSDTFEGLEVRRTSLKYRNPENRPDSVDENVLMAFEQAKAAGRDLVPVFVEGAEGQAARFYSPIVVEAICLNCHGARESLSPEVTALLDGHYPDDLATEYAEGDVRGAFRVSFGQP
jgi:hypothetical protein